MKNEKLNVLLLGSGGREHALYLAIKKSPMLSTITVAPGNGGIAKTDKANLNPENFVEITNYCKEHNIDFVISGPEAPLVKGISDFLEKSGISCLGPDSFGAKMEGSKKFAKEIMKKSGVATAEYEYFTDKEKALEYLKEKTFPIVIKADGLAAGKGVSIADNFENGKLFINEIFSGKFGKGKQSVVMEEFLQGQECSIFGICSGDDVLVLRTSQDHKQVGEKDTGENTGGMGAYSPTPVVSPQLAAKTKESIFLPVLKTLKDLGHPFRGILYAGLMVQGENIKLLEFNVRFGDPETQIVLPALKTDLLSLLWQASQGKLTTTNLEWEDKHYLTVVLAAKGYPGSYKKDIAIQLPKLEEQEGLWIHAGTKADEKKDDLFYSTGGRVLNLVVWGKNLQAAQDKAYAILDKNNFKDLFYRSDIGWRVL